MWFGLVWFGLVCLPVDNPPFNQSVAKSKVVDNFLGRRKKEKGDVDGTA